MIVSPGLDYLLVIGPLAWIKKETDAIINNMGLSISSSIAWRRFSWANLISARDHGHTFPAISAPLIQSPCPDQWEPPELTFKDSRENRRIRLISIHNKNRPSSITTYKCSFSDLNHSSTAKPECIGANRIIGVWDLMKVCLTRLNFIQHTGPISFADNGMSLRWI